MLLNEHLNEVVEFDKPNGGMAIWVRFKKEYPLPVIAAKAAVRGMVMSNGIAFDTDQDFNAARFGFASLTTEEMEQAILLLKEVVQGSL